MFFCSKREEKRRVGKELRFKKIVLDSNHSTNDSRYHMVSRLSTGDLGS